MTTKIICAVCGAPWYDTRKGYCNECHDTTAPLILTFDAPAQPYPGFRTLHGRNPITGRDFNPDKGLCQDDYEYLTGTGRYR